MTPQRFVSLSFCLRMTDRTEKMTDYTADSLEREGEKSRRERGGHRRRTRPTPDRPCCPSLLDSHACPEVSPGSYQAQAERGRGRTPKRRSVLPGRETLSGRAHDPLEELLPTEAAQLPGEVRARAAAHRRAGNSRYRNGRFWVSLDSSARVRTSG